SDARIGGLVADSSGNLYVAGESYEAFDAGVELELSSAFVLALNSSGTRGWTHFFGGSSYDAVTAMALSPDGALLVAGTTQDALGTISDTTQRDMFTAKISPGSSSFAWSKHERVSGDTFAHGIAVDSAGNAIVSGKTNGEIEAGASKN